MTSEHKRTGRFAPEILHKYFLCHEKYLKYQEKFIRKENVISKIIKKQADDLFKIAVALHAGAWIEISLKLLIPFSPFVALHAGAWIEIPDRELLHMTLPSHSMRVRGLKSMCSHASSNKTVSHSMRVRGLKYTYGRFFPESE